MTQYIKIFYSCWTLSIFFCNSWDFYLMITRIYFFQKWTLSWILCSWIIIQYSIENQKKKLSHWSQNVKATNASKLKEHWIDYDDDENNTMHGLYVFKMKIYWKAQYFFIFSSKDTSLLILDRIWCFFQHYHYHVQCYVNETEECKSTYKLVLAEIVWIIEINIMNLITVKFSSFIFLFIVIEEYWN